MNPAILYRPMRLADAPSVHALEQSIFPTPWSLKSIRFEVENDQTSDPWVALDVDNAGEEKLVGYLVAWRLVDELHIANIAVHPDYRRRGIGQRLLQDALLRAREEGLQQACLEVRGGNTLAQALYRHFGFKPVGLRKRYYQDNREDALIMCLENLESVPELKPEPR